jgi:hypothetical protein
MAVPAWLAGCDAQQAEPATLEPSVSVAVERDVAAVDLESSVRTDEVRTELRREVTGFGRALGSGKPVAGVAIWQAEREPGVISAADGSFTLVLDELAPATILCFVDGERYAHFRAGEVESAERCSELVIQDRTTDIEIDVIERQFSPLFLRVINARTEGPVPGRTVRVESLSTRGERQLLRPRNGVTDAAGFVRIEKVRTGPIEVWVPPHRASHIVHRGAGASPLEYRIAESPPIDVTLTGLEIGEQEAWRIAFAREDAIGLEGLEKIAYGRGQHAHFVPAPAVEEQMRVEGDWLLLAVDGTFYGELRGGPSVLERQHMSFAVEATLALELLTSTPGSGPIIDLSGEERELEPPSVIQEWLPHGGRKDFRHAVERLSFSQPWSNSFQRLHSGKWLPLGDYRVSLVSPHLRAESVQVAASERGVQRVTLSAESRDDLVRLEVEVRSTAGHEWSDMPRLTMSEAGMIHRTYDTSAPGSMIWGGTAQWYRQLPNRRNGTFGFQIDDVQPQDLSFTVEAGTLHEEREPIVNGELRVRLEFTPAADQPEPR